MSELRKRCEYIIKQLEDYIFVVNGRAHINPEAISRIIEALAREQQIKGMEAVLTEIKRRKNIIANDVRPYPRPILADWIDAEIAKLKEGHS